MPRAISIADGETEKIVAESEPQGRYEFEVRKNEVRLGARKQNAPEGRRIDPQRPGFVVKDEKTEAIWAHASDGDAEIEVEKSQFEINLYAPMVARAGRQNKDGVVGDTITPGTGGATFADQDVPDGFDVVVQNDPSNTDNVQVQDDDGTDRHVLSPGSTISLAVSNLDEITVTGTANNPSVHATVEAP